MSSISIDIPTLEINSYGLKNLVNYISRHEQTLKEFGAIKIKLNSDCLLGLKTQKISSKFTNIQKIVKISNDEPIYSIKKIEGINDYMKEHIPILNEETFWSSFIHSNHKHEQSAASILLNKSLFLKNSPENSFSIHHIPKQSLLKLVDTQIIPQFVPCLTRSHEPGTIFPLSDTQQRLFSLIYHHDGGSRCWYIIPSCERETLLKLLYQKSSSTCFQHDHLFINPSILDKHHIRYHRIIQYSNEFIVLSAGTISQSFTTDACWTESIPFALPSWIRNDHVYNQHSTCQCKINQISEAKTINMNLSQSDPVQKSIDQYRNVNNNNYQHISISTG
ncbi:unnamed protein product [Adineta steineri]|uniref:JmjC domain-containing protein n=1 Tax=Adineta steineri TaxID=433720 RepID=A0A815FTM6_9BILA|nr:unnamed protein product [Adineta steineri]CAF1588622.1 unnamed protein product [Adineta steineri]